MGRAVQLKFFDDHSLVHGGSSSGGKRKTRRPFSSKKPIHLVLRLEEKNRVSLLSHGKRVRYSLSQVSRKWAVRVYRFSVNSNHLHLLIRARHRREFQGFLRHFTGMLVMQLTRSRKTMPLASRFFLPPFTRIGNWGRAFETLKRYVRQNELEANNVIAYQPRHPKKRKPAE